MVAQDYRIGLTSVAANMTNLVDDPFPAEIADELVAFTLSGNPINVAMQTVTWKWTNMSQAGWNQIYAFWATNIQVANPPPYIYIRTLKEAGNNFEYGVFRCRMGKPTSEVNKLVAEVRDAEVIFYQCELL